MVCTSYFWLLLLRRVACTLTAARRGCEAVRQRVCPEDRKSLREGRQEPARAVAPCFWLCALNPGPERNSILRSEAVSLAHMAHVSHGRPAAPDERHPPGVALVRCLGVRAAEQIHQARHKRGGGRRLGGRRLRARGGRRGFRRVGVDSRGPRSLTHFGNRVFLWQDAW